MVSAPDGFWRLMKRCIFIAHKIEMINPEICTGKDKQVIENE